MNIRNLYSKRTLLLLLCATILLLGSASKVLADSYNVTAVVPYDPPTAAATVGAPSDNTTVNTNTVDITGTCQILNPASIISVWNGTTLLGSTACQVGGTYSINVALYEGVNVLIVKSSNVNTLYGPDSLPFTITYTLDVPPAPAPEPDPVTGETLHPPAPSGAAANPVASGELLITSTAPFGVTDEKNSVSITIRVTGGGNPYKLTINWGDGSTMTQDIEDEGDYTFTHIYESASIYNVVALVRDVLGTSRSFNWVVTPKTQSLNSDGKTVAVIPVSEPSLKPYVYASVALASTFLVATTFLGGRYYQALQLAKGAQNVKKSPKKRVKKK